MWYLRTVWKLRKVQKQLPFRQHQEWVVYRCSNELFSFILCLHYNKSVPQSCQSLSTIALVVLNSFQIKALFLYDRKTSQNLCFSDIYWVCRMGTLEYEKFNISSNKISSKLKLNIKTGNIKKIQLRHALLSTTT